MVNTRSTKFEKEMDTSGPPEWFLKMEELKEKRRQEEKENEEKRRQEEEERRRQVEVEIINSLSQIQESFTLE
ncbi:unconventional myosin-VI-like [Diabrotica virgifera virgifera]|uniref:Uncharacterized protein n=1 Tax=Diabrotica virgifera virgifera TaxID=50390 RepID=A0ABM5KPE6_DIAVI|nr:unconventional myosin-VI-like [Diabrotica virgifera virgifera]XP_050512056.1 unconventional myosin-VI-like [Diabrotica virgifera virgifera]